MVRLNARGKKFFGAIAKVGSNISKSIKDYEAQAPQRRSAEITRLKQEIRIAKLKKQKKALMPKEDFYF